MNRFDPLDVQLPPPDRLPIVKSSNRLELPRPLHPTPPLAKDPR